MDLKDRHISDILRLVSNSDCVYNLTISPKHTIDDVDTYSHIDKFLEPALRMGLSVGKKQLKEGFDFQWSFVGVKERFPNTPTRCHVHGQLFIKYDFNYLPNDKVIVWINDCINKFHGLVNKKVGNTKISKNISLGRMKAMRRQLGLPEPRLEYPEYTNYMFKEFKSDHDMFWINRC